MLLEERVFCISAPLSTPEEIGTLIGAEIDDSHIAAAHRLPDSKNVKNRLIVKNSSKGA